MAGYGRCQILWPHLQAMPDAQVVQAGLKRGRGPLAPAVRVEFLTLATRLFDNTRKNRCHLCLALKSLGKDEAAENVLQNHDVCW